jgi:hypothetical protein
MKNVLLTLFALGLAGLAAIAATTAMLNAPVVHNIGPPKSEQPAGATQPGTPPATPPDTPPSTPSPAETPPAAPPSGGQPAPAPAPSTSGGAGSDEPESDKDPYEGIAPEDLPPDLQYDADASVSFPTNT